MFQNKFLISSKINSKFHSVYQACSHNKTWCRWFFIWYSMMATWRLFRPLKTFYFSRNSDQVMSLLFSRSMPRFKEASRQCRPKWSMMTCSILIMTRVKILKVANGTRIENFYDLEPNNLSISYWRSKKAPKLNEEKCSLWKKVINQTFSLKLTLKTHYDKTIY